MASPTLPKKAIQKEKEAGEIAIGKEKGEGLVTSGRIQL